ncbi:MAG: chromosome segregation protein SMC [Acidobacteriota bacterium]|nr:chromosome segregation protein SMC [Acidobacteriota bacterium]
MFRLQRLEITGFKSFADYTEVIFTERGGITAVVGPNGCGKSNVSDAIAWVLGEQSAKSLRGAEMQDVIFQGTRQRQPSGMAEVVLHFVRDDSFADLSDTDDIDEALSEFDEQISEFEDFENPSSEIVDSPPENGFHPESNGHGSQIATVATAVAPAKTQNKRRWKSRRAQLDFAPGEAVSITRRLYRSGESEYLLNNRACRLRDIQDLFSGTGLSGAHYALIQQERISQILSSKPSDRRALIEEAAGITKFRTRQRAAEVRLESAKNNLRRLSDIVSEVERQTNALRRQAARTRRYKQMRDELRELQRKVFVAEGKELTANLTDLREKLAAAIAEEQGLIEVVAVQTEKSRMTTQAAREAEEILTEIRQQISEAAIKRERAARDFSHQTEQSSALEERCAALRFEIKSNEKRLREIADDRDRLREKNEQASKSNQTESADLQTAEADFRQKQTEVSRLESEIEETRHQLLQHTAAAERLREIAKQQANALERLAERAEGLEREQARAEQTFVEKKREAAELETKVAVQREHLADLKARKEKALESVKQAQISLREAESVFNKIRDEANGVRHRRETLEKLDASNSMLAPAVQKLFAAREKIGVRLNGTLADLFDVEARFEKAVEAVFGARLQTVLIESHEDAKKIADWLRTNNAGKLDLLVIEQNPAANGRGEAGIKKENSQVSSKSAAVKLFDVLGISGDLEKELSVIFAEQKVFHIVENFSTAENLPEENCVTLDGELIYKNRLFSLGKIGKETGGILSFKRELRELAEKAGKLKSELEAAEETVKNARADLAKQENFITDFQSQILLAERELMSLGSRFDAAKQDRERAERHQKVVADEILRLADERTETENKRAKAEREAKTAESERVAAQEKLGEISAHLLGTKREAEHFNSVLSERRAAAAAEAERRRSLQNALRRVENDYNELDFRLEKQRKELEETDLKFENLRKSLHVLERQIATAESEKRGESEKLAAATKNLQTARAAADCLSIELNESNKKASAAKDQRAALEVAQAETATKLENLRENCHQELGEQLENLFAGELFDDFDLPEEKRRLESLREKLDSFGAVNLLALEELSEAEERLLFLSSQRKDIVDSIAVAEEALGEIKRRSRERFETAFAEINRNFSELFAELFGGGRGEMNLLDAADVLESGIEIIAQPPGKRLQNLLLLSGGEKAMTAIALVLAIFRFRPAPFCLLDEVDAPLDEANVGRFVDKIALMSENTQFIVITHNKRTMEAARALYGVTMEEAGVSKVVSVKFE